MLDLVFELNRLGLVLLDLVFEINRLGLILLGFVFKLNRVDLILLKFAFELNPRSFLRFNAIRQNFFSRSNPLCRDTINENINHLKYFLK